MDSVLNESVMDRRSCLSQHVSLWAEFKHEIFGYGCSLYCPLMIGHNHQYQKYAVKHLFGSLEDLLVATEGIIDFRLSFVQSMNLRYKH